MPDKPLRTTEFIALFSLMTAMTALGIDFMLPALSEIGEALGVEDRRNTQLIVSMFFLGMVLGEVVFGPVSDAIGRKRAIMIGLTIYSLGALIAMTAVSLEQIVLGRIVQGFGAAGPKIGSRALIRDLYRGEAMARIMSIILMVFMIVPMIAPAGGQIILNVVGWRSLFLVFVVVAVLVGTWMALRQPETLKPDMRLPISARSLFANSRLILAHPRVMANAVAMGCVFGAFLSYLGTAEALFDDLYQAGNLFAVYFAILSVGQAAVFFLNSRLVMRFGMVRLCVGALVFLFLVSGLLIAIAARHGGVPPFTAFMGCCLVMFGCFGVLLGNLNAMAMESLGRVAGLGTSVVSSVSTLTGVIFAVTAGRFYDATALPLSFSFLIASVVGFGLVIAATRSSAGDI